MATFKHIVCVILVVVTTVNADVTARHKWPAKTTIGAQTNTTPVLLN